MKRVVTLFISFSVSIVANCGSAAIFTGSGTIDDPDANGAGIIPDSPYTGPAQYGSPLIVSFTVSNLESNVQNLAVSITMTHQWVGDLDVYLTSPQGTNFTIFSQVGPDQWDSNSQTSSGYGSANLLDGTYFFDDYATNTLCDIGYELISQGLFNWGNPLTWTNIIPGGIYQTSTEGPAPDPAQNIPNTMETNTTFHSNSGLIGLIPAKANGTWTLTFLDGSATGTGTVTTATLYINELTIPHISSITAMNGIVQLNLMGPFNHGFSLWRSTNLALPFSSWQKFGGGMFDNSGIAAYDSDVTAPQYFYRLSVP